MYAFLFSRTVYFGNWKNELVVLYFNWTFALEKCLEIASKPMKNTLTHFSPCYVSHRNQSFVLLCNAALGCKGLIDFKIVLGKHTKHDQG